MAVSRTEQLTAQFYDWERRGRGWYIFENPIHLEPEFVPFFGHFLPEENKYVDDGIRKNLFQKAFSLLKKKEVEIEQQESYYDTVDAYNFESDVELTAFRITIPKEHVATLEQNEALLLMLASAEYPVSFEIIGTSDKIHLQFVSRISDGFLLRTQIKAFFPEIIITENYEFVEQIIIDEGFGHLIDFGLQEEFMRPLHIIEGRNKIDTLTSIFGVLDSLKGNERIIIQILFSKVINPWSENILRSVLDSNGDSFFLDAPEMVKCAQEKISSPLFAVSIRTITQADTEDDSLPLLQQITNAIQHVSRSPFNSLIPLVTNLYPFKLRLQDIIYRESHRIGFLINTRELATFVHLPNESIRSQKLDRDIKKTNPAPTISGNEFIILGENEHQGKIQEVKIETQERLKHTHIIGATGTGKSTLILQLIKQDIESGRGVCVLDPHGDLIESVFSFIPENRIQDVLILDPADSEFPVSFNILEAHSEIEKEILSSDLVGGFKRLSTSWGDQMNSVLANAILAFLESNKGGTLADLRRFLIEKEYRNEFLKSVRDPSIQYYWLKEYPLLKSNSIGSILTRLDTFLRPKVIRNMVSQQKGINFEHLINSNKIILVKLSHGLIGVENSYLLGTFVVSKIHQAVMARQAMEKETRNNFFLYIDEFQNFITPSMSAILSGARKYHLGLILAHQDLQQLVKNDNELASSVLSNAGTRICFRLSDTDAKRLSDGFSHFEALDLQNLSVGEAIARIGKPDNDFNLATNQINTTRSSHRNEIIQASRIQYATSRNEVEALLIKTYEGITLEIPKEEKSIKKEEPIVEQPEVKNETFEIVEIVDEKVKEKLGRKEEQTRHRYLQTLIKKMAEERGYKAVVEEELPGRIGRVDVHIEGHGKRIACEVKVTTTDEWELHNIEKCLNAGYDFVFECSTEEKVIERLQSKISEAFQASLKKILVGSPESLFSFLDEHIVKEELTKEVQMKGYRVKIEYDSLSQTDMNKKRESISKVVIDSLKKSKK